MRRKGETSRVAVMAVTVDLHPLARLVLPMLAIGGGVWLLVRLALAKGRPAD